MRPYKALLQGPVSGELAAGMGPLSLRVSSSAAGAQSSELGARYRNSWASGTSLLVGLITGLPVVSLWALPQGRT